MLQEPALQCLGPCCRRSQGQGLLLLLLLHWQQRWCQEAVQLQRVRKGESERKAGLEGERGGNKGVRGQRKR